MIVREKVGAAVHSVVSGWIVKPTSRGRTTTPLLLGLAKIRTVAPSKVNTAEPRLLWPVGLGSG